MRRLLYALLTISALAACLRTDPDRMRCEYYDLQVSLADQGRTKTSLQPDGAVIWTVDDSITIAFGVRGDTYDGRAVGVEGQNATFRFNPGASDVFTEAIACGDIYGRYPAGTIYSLWGNPAIPVEIPDNQEAIPGTFPEKGFPAVAHGEGFPLKFYNVCGGVRFTVTRDDVVSVSFSGNGDEVIAGEFYVHFNEYGLPYTEPQSGKQKTKILLKPADDSAFEAGKWYYITMAPAALERGYKLVFNYRDGSSSVRERRRPISVSRSVWGSIEDADKELDIVEDARIIRYTTTDGNPVEINGSRNGLWGQQFWVVSNECEDGVWTMKFNDALTILPMGAFADCTTLRTVDLPSCITELGENGFSGCTNLESVTLPGTTKGIPQAFFQGCKKITSVPEGLESIGAFAYMDSGVTQVNVYEGMREIGVSAFYKCDLEWVKVYAGGPVKGSINMFGSGDGQNFPIYIYTSEDDYVCEDWWIDYELRRADDSLIETHVYTSTDYSRDGEVLVLQQATVGRGIQMVFMGDGFTDKDIYDGGPYEVAVRRAVDKFFSIEPYRSLRDRFNVYAVNVVSATDHYLDKFADRAVTYDLKDNTEFPYQPREESIHRYMQLVPGYSEQEMHILLVCNPPKNGPNFNRSNCTNLYLADELTFLASVSINSSNNMLDDDRLGNLILHETGGHGIGRLGDEYGGGDVPFTEEEKQLFDANMRYTENWVNLDIISDPAEVRWAHLLSDERFAGEDFGVYQGGGGDGNRRYFRPSQDGIMCCNNFGYFNPPCREAIYKFVMRATEPEGWQYDYGAFVAFDAPGHEQASQARY